MVSKIKMLGKNNLHLLFFSLLLGGIVGCWQKERGQRPFFLPMQESYQLGLEMDTHRYRSYMKDFEEFGLSKRPTVFRGKRYYQIFNNTSNPVNMAGYVRVENHKLFLLPLGFKNKHEDKWREQIFIDFNAKRGEEWITYFAADSSSYNKIKFMQKKYWDVIQDSVYLYKVSYCNPIGCPLMIYEVHPSYGFIGFLLFDRKHEPATTITLYPKAVIPSSDNPSVTKFNSVE
jgi:hypothetical protein